jgi:beta-galactosidase/beta-glucuronidase
MSKPHVIRLRGPWDLEPLARDVPTGGGGYRREVGDLPAGGRVQVPGDWQASLGAHFVGCVRYTRRFNCPTNLGPDERVWLAFDGVDYQSQVTLNAQALGAVQGYGSPSRIEITSLLEPRNVLALDISLPAIVFNDEQLRPGRAGQAGGLIGEVRLEISSGPP